MKMKQLATLIALAALALGPGACSRQTPESLIAGAEVSIGKGDYRTAVVQLKSALEQDQNNARARWLLGEVYLDGEDGVGAEKEIRRAGELGVVDDSVIPALAQALLLQGKVDQVLELVDSGSLSPRAKGELAAAQGLSQLAKGDAKAGDELTAKGLTLAPASSFAASTRARFLVSEQRLDEAEQILTQLQSSHPAYGLAWSLHGDVHAARKDYVKAEEAYSVAMTKRLINADDRLKRASVRVELKKLDEAQADAQELTKRFPKLQAAWYLSGFIHFQKQELPAAKDALERSYALDEEHVPTLILLSWANVLTGGNDRAVELAERAAAVAPSSFLHASWWQW